MRVCPRCTVETEAELCPADGARTIAVQPGQATYHSGMLIADRYQVDGVIGIGGFGAVYRCTQLTMNQTVAVKVLRSEHLSSVEHVKRFTREAQAVSKLSHPNTIRIFDFGSHSDGALYLAMEFLEGETLADRLERQTMLPWQATVRIATQICHSLTEAHGQGLVHRDLKPENVMLMAVAGDPDFVKVLDFGIAKVQKEPGKPGEASLTETGMIMGTPTYMSPEQAKGETIDGRSDIYALGVMLFEALTGVPPFQDETAMKVLVAHIQAPVPPFARTGRHDEPPPELEQVVRACLEKEPSRRPQTSAALADALAAAVRRAQERGQASPADDQPTATMPSVERLPETVVVTAAAGEHPQPAARQDSAPAASEPATPAAIPSVPSTAIWLGVGALVAVSVLATVAWLLIGKSAGPAPAATVAIRPATTRAQDETANTASVVASPVATVGAPAAQPAPLQPAPADAVAIPPALPPAQPAAVAPAAEKAPAVAPVAAAGGAVPTVRQAPSTVAAPPSQPAKPPAAAPSTQTDVRPPPTAAATAATPVRPTPAAEAQRPAEPKKPESVRGTEPRPPAKQDWSLDDK